jgi:hypothetical protein
MEQSEPRFEAAVQIGKRFKTVDRTGSVTIDHGRLTLRRANGEVVAEGPVSEVHADTSRLAFGGGAVVWIGGERYFVGPASGWNPGSAPGAAVKVARQTKAGKQLKEELLAVIEAEGGRIGKPGG